MGAVLKSEISVKIAPNLCLHCDRVVYVHNHINFVPLTHRRLANIYELNLMVVSYGILNIMIVGDMIGLMIEYSPSVES